MGVYKETSWKKQSNINEQQQQKTNKNKHIVRVMVTREEGCGKGKNGYRWSRDGDVWKLLRSRSMQESLQTITWHPWKERGKQALARKSLLACSTALTSCDQADVVLEPKSPVRWNVHLAGLAGFRTPDVPCPWLGKPQTPWPLGDPHGRCRR